MNDKKMVLVDRELLEKLLHNQKQIEKEYILTQNCPYVIKLSAAVERAIEKAPGAVLPVTQAHEWTCCPIFKYTSGKNKRCRCYENCPQIVKE